MHDHKQSPVCSLDDDDSIPTYETVGAEAPVPNFFVILQMPASKAVADSLRFDNLNETFRKLKRVREREAELQAEQDSRDLVPAWLLA